MKKSFPHFMQKVSKIVFTLYSRNCSMLTVVHSNFKTPIILSISPEKLNFLLYVVSLIHLHIHAPLSFRVSTNFRTLHREAILQGRISFIPYMRKYQLVVPELQTATSFKTRIYGLFVNDDVHALQVHTPAVADK